MAMMMTVTNRSSYLVCTHDGCWWCDSSSSDDHTARPPHGRCHVQCACISTFIYTVTSLANTIITMCTHIYDADDDAGITCCHVIIRETGRDTAAQTFLVYYTENKSLGSTAVLHFPNDAERVRPARVTHHNCHDIV